MKKIFYLMMAVALLCNCAPEEGAGGIYGVITDQASGEPMRAAGVELFQYDALITKTVTGNEGQYEFLQLSSGNYELNVVFSGYANAWYTVTVSGGKTTRADMQLQKINTGMTVRTLDITNIGGNFARLNGSSSNQYSSDRPDECGFVYATHANPSNGGTRITATTTGNDYASTFSTTITNLAKATYYVQAYAKNQKGTEYGEVRSFQITGAPSSAGGYDDWRLPTREELKIVYNNRNIIGGFITANNTRYWSSEKDGSSNAWTINFNNGSDSSISAAATSLARARCVRRP